MRHRAPRKKESGSAFVISILVLFVLTVLGMALMLTTTTETDISVNYRWGEMAFFNADAALEYGKNVLAAWYLQEGDFRKVLPAPRDVSQMTQKPGPPPDDGDCDATTAGCRDHQYSLERDPTTIIYIGRVLRDIDGRAIRYDFRDPVAGDTRGDIDGDLAPDIQGTATVWVRRPLAGDRDDIRNDRVVLTAEGTAPSYDALGSRAVSVRRVEMVIRIPDAVTTEPTEDYASEDRSTDRVGLDSSLGTSSQGAEAGNVVTTFR